MGQHRPVLVHATAVALPLESGWAGVLLRGPSGSGKSDLALRLIDQGARLIADDQTELCIDDGIVSVCPPARLAGHLEVRGLGLVTVPSLERAPLVLVVDLVRAADIERLPQPQTVTLAGVELAMLRLAPFEASAPAKLRVAVKTVAHGTFGALDRLALP